MIKQQKQNFRLFIDVSKSLERKHGINETLQTIIERISSFLQSPNYMGCKLVYKRKSFKTSNFTKSDIKIKSNIKVRNKKQGYLQINFSGGERSIKKGGTSLEEKRELITVIAEMIGRYLGQYLVKKNY
ncbi:MAG: hypothetical protein ACOC1P_03215 [Minisyncoccales bacterium]